MKKYLLLLFTGIFLSCNDGDFTVPNFEFTEELNSCGEYLLYKTSAEETEAIFISLTSSQLSTLAGEKNFTINSSFPVTYRKLDAPIGTDYFCQEIPPLEPKVTRELVAESGTLIIVTSLEEENGVVTKRNYEIYATNLEFSNDGERIFFETFSFGTLSIPN